MHASRYHAIRPTRALAALLFLAAGAVAASPAGAQSSPSSNALLSLDETRVCICLEDEITRMRGGRTDAENPLWAEFKRLDALVEQARPNVDPYDQAEVDSFRRLHERREELRRQLQAQGLGLGGLVRRYNAQCAYRKMLKLNVDAVRANPQCPPL